MACYCTSLSPSFLPSLFLPQNQSKFYSSKCPKIILRKVVSCHNVDNSETHELSEPESRFRKSHLSFLQVSVTLTVISASLPHPLFAAKLSEKKRTVKKSEALTPQELEKWSQGLPAVTHRLPYSEIISLRRENKLKHIIKPPNVGFKQRPEVVLGVLEDSKVVRVVLPSVDADPRFWEQWDELKLDEACMNAYSPPLKKPEIPSPYLGVLGNIPMWMFSFVKPKPQSKKALELKRMREEFKRRRKEEFEKMREDREMVEKAAKMEKKIEQSRFKKEMKKIKFEESLRKAQIRSEAMSIFWHNVAKDANVVGVLGILFFFIFYNTVVVSYKKHQKDYEDRRKIEKAEAEERKKMRELEREMEGVEGEDDEEEGGKEEQNSYMKMATQFMKSGARVRRARSKKLSQYLERGLDVKFSDVAGLGKIRAELEEIVKFFTHGEMYRRRGVRIPGPLLS